MNDTTSPRLRPEWLIDRQGKQVVLYAGLLALGHEDGLQSIKTQLLQIPAEDNERVAICSAEVTMKDGRTFSGIGDASPRNVARPMVEMIIRFAETRAKARALRDAVNVGLVALEELGEGGPEPIEMVGEKLQKLRDKWARLTAIGVGVGVVMPEMPARYDDAYQAIQVWWRTIQAAEHPATASPVSDDDLPF